MAAEAVFIPTLYISISHSAAFHCSSRGTANQPQPGGELQRQRGGEGWAAGAGKLFETQAVTGILHEEPSPSKHAY